MEPEERSLVPVTMLEYDPTVLHLEKAAAA